MRKPQLFLLHFAGGSRYSFQFLIPYLSMFEVIPLELPGRGKRMNEPLLIEFDEAAKDLYDQLIAQLTTDNFLIYGHSMGAYLTLRIANMLERAGRPATGIIVSGNAGPGIQQEDKKIRYLLDREAFMDELRVLGGIPAELLKNKEMMSFFEPILRADFEIVERNEMEAEPATQTSLFAIMGSEEENVTLIDNWSRFTTGSFNAEVLEGDHFFIHRHASRLAAIISACTKKSDTSASIFNH